MSTISTRSGSSSSISDPSTSLSRVGCESSGFLQILPFDIPEAEIVSQGTASIGIPIRAKSVTLEETREPRALSLSWACPC